MSACATATTGMNCDSQSGGRVPAVPAVRGRTTTGGSTRRCQARSGVGVPRYHREQLSPKTYPLSGCVQAPSRGMLTHRQGTNTRVAAVRYASRCRHNAGTEPHTMPPTPPVHSCRTHSRPARRREGRRWMSPGMHMKHREFIQAAYRERTTPAMWTTAAPSYRRHTS